MENHLRFEFRGNIFVDVSNSMILSSFRVFGGRLRDMVITHVVNAAREV